MIIRVVGVIEHSKGQHVEPSWWLVFKDMLPQGGRKYVIRISDRCSRWHIESGPCSESEVNRLHEYWARG